MIGTGRVHVRQSAARARPTLVGKGVAGGAAARQGVGRRTSRTRPLRKACLSLNPCDA